jgi:hypothetical protein
VDELEQEITQLKLSRAKAAEEMRQALLRGVCALNLETMGAFHADGTPTTNITTNMAIDGVPMTTNLPVDAQRLLDAASRVSPTHPHGYLSKPSTDHDTLIPPTIPSLDTKHNILDGGRRMDGDGTMERYTFESHRMVYPSTTPIPRPPPPVKARHPAQLHVAHHSGPQRNVDGHSSDGDLGSRSCMGMSTGLVRPEARRAPKTIHPGRPEISATSNVFITIREHGNSSARRPKVSRP